MSSFNLKRFKAGQLPNIYDVYKKTPYAYQFMNISVQGRDMAEARVDLEKKHSIARDNEEIVLQYNEEKSKVLQQEKSQQRLLRQLKKPKTPAEEQAIQSMWDIAP